MTARFLIVVLLCMGASLGAQTQAGEHLLFRSVVRLEYGNPYRIFLSLHFHENQGASEAFTVRRTIETFDSERKTVYSQTESVLTLAFAELVALGESGFSLLTIPGTTLNGLYLKALDPQDPQSTLGLSYPIDARPTRKEWGWLPLEIVRDGSAFRLVDRKGMPYAYIKMEVNYQDYWGTKPVGLSVFQPVASSDALPQSLSHRFGAN